MTYIAVSGNIATGKSTLAKIIEDDLGFLCVTERPEQNSFLSDFYFDMKRWAFHSQLSFILTRHCALMAATSKANKVVLDRSVDEDFHIFVKAMCEYGNLDSREFRLVEAFFETLKAQTPSPQLYIYLSDEPESLFKRILLRGNQYESKIELDYLRKLDGLYTLWRKNLSETPVLDIETGNIDFRKAAGREAVVKKIRDAIEQLRQK